MKNINVLKTICLSSLWCVIPQHLFIYSCASEGKDPLDNTFDIKVTNSNCSLNITSYKESEGIKYLDITDNNSSEIIIGVSSFCMTSKSGETIQLLEGSDFIFYLFDGDKRIQFQNINSDKLHGDLSITLKIKVEPPAVEFNVVMDNASVLSSITKIKEGTRLETVLSLEKATDLLEIDSIAYIRIGKNELSKNDYLFDYKSSTLSIENSSLINDDVHISVNIVDKIHKINIETIGLQGTSVISSVKQIDNHQSLTTQLSINIDTNNYSSLCFGELTISIGDRELAKDDYNFTIDWSVPTLATLTINEILIKNDIFITVEVCTKDIHQYYLFFYDGVKTVLSPYIADDINGYSQSNISTFYKSFLWDDSTKSIDYIKICVDIGGSEIEWLDEHVDFEYNSDILTINPTAIVGNLKVFIIPKGGTDSNFEKESFETIFHYLDVAKGFESLGLITEKELFLNLYHPINDSFVGLIIEDPINIFGHDYTFRVIGQEQDTVAESDVYYDPNNTKAFLTLQITKTFEGGLGYRAVYLQYDLDTESDVLWTNDNKMKVDLDSITPYFPLPIRLVRQVVKQRYISTFDHTEKSIEMFFGPSWSEFGAGIMSCNNSDGISENDGMGSGASYSYYTGSKIEVANKRNELIDLQNDYLTLTSPLLSNRSEYAACISRYTSTSGEKRARGEDVYKNEYYDRFFTYVVIPWCFCI